MSHFHTVLPVKHGGICLFCVFSGVHDLVQVSPTVQNNAFWKHAQILLQGLFYFPSPQLIPKEMIQEHNNNIETTYKKKKVSQH